MGRGDARNHSGRHNTDVHPMGGDSQAEQGNHGNGGIPTPHHHPHMVSANNSKSGVMTSTKMAGGGILGEANGNHGRIYRERFQEFQAANKSTGVNEGEEILRDNVGEQVVHEDHRDTEKRIFNVEQLEVLQTKLITGPATWVSSAEAGLEMAKAAIIKQSPKEDVAASTKKDKAQPAGIITTQPNRQAKEPDFRMAEPGGAKYDQVRNKNSIVMWKRVSRVEGGETDSIGTLPAFMGKRKAEVKGSINEDQRHLKIRKWEDYLEEEEGNRNRF
jgi:hypothetical protein